ncbi:MAG TPA: hypothetical protein DHV83_02615 [Prevotella sp.]|nr:hypothetical protein [Prevotella sp.]
MLCLSNPRTPVTIERAEACIKCGHCVDVCPTNGMHR